MYLRNKRHNRLTVITGNPHVPSFYRDTEKLYFGRSFHKKKKHFHGVVHSRERQGKLETTAVETYFSRTC